MTFDPAPLDAFFDRHETLRRRLFLAAKIGLVSLAAISVSLGTIYLAYSSFVSKRLNEAVEGNVIYSGPVELAVGDVVSLDEIAGELRRAGYTKDGKSGVGSYKTFSDAIEIRPGPESYAPANAVRIRLAQGAVAGITGLETNAEFNRYSLEPQPLASISNRELGNRRRVSYAEIPRVLVRALLAAEDKRFFVHAGLDPLRLIKAAWVNMRTSRRDQGGSTITMQLARSLCLDSQKTVKRKAEEIMIAGVLELKLTKQQILEHYVNRVYLGRRDGIPVYGFAQASQTYFGHPLGELTLPEAALLAGMVQRPSYFDPDRHLDRAMTRRNLVLALMQKNGFLTADEKSRASTVRPSIAAAGLAGGDSEWFVEMTAEELEDRSPEETAARVYTTLDPALQRAAVEAVRASLPALDKLASGRTGHGRPEVALVAIDSHTGQVKALVGGRDFSRSQVNHAVAQRAPGSAFKPFVYAAALQSNSKSFTPATVLNDDPTTFKFGAEEYTPGNYGHSFGQLSLRKALALSDNIAAVSVAEQVGYGKVLQLALNSGLNKRLGATPALALGAYETTPLELAGAYTIFANGGQFVRPELIAEMRSKGAAPRKFTSETRPVLQRPVAFLMQDLLTEVIRSGTAWGVHQAGFNTPAAGKTGTSHDGWFAGFVSNLICVVWVGFDDNADLKLEGAKSALPIWTEFMKRAARRAEYRQPLGSAPPGVTAASIDPDTGLLAGPHCDKTRYEYFLRGTEPTEVCQHLTQVGVNSASN